MLAKQLSISKRCEPLVAYLFGPGRHNEHKDQRIIGGSALITSHAVFDLPRDKEAQASLANDLDGAWQQVRREQGLSVRANVRDKGKGAAKAEHVFHATLSLAKDEGALSDEQWEKAARMFVQKMRFIDSQDGADCSWLAVHHGFSKEGNDHVHIVVNLVREDGRKANIHQSKRRTAKAGAEVAKAMGLMAVFEAERSSGIGNVSRAELERANRERRDADRRLIRRKLASAAWNADSEADFVRRVRGEGVLVRPRFARGGQGVVEGYSVALAGSGKPVWFAPSKLDRSLGLPLLRQRYKWTQEMQHAAVAVWRDSRARMPDMGVRMPSVDDVKELQMKLSYGNAKDWRSAAHDTSAMISAYALEMEGGARGLLARASDALSQAAQPNRGTSVEVLRQSVQTLFSVAMAGSRSSVTGSAALMMQVMRMLDSMQQRAAVERELESSRRKFEQALASLSEQRKLWGQQARAETFAALPDDVRNALASALPGEREIREGRSESKSNGSEGKELSQLHKVSQRPSSIGNRIETIPESER